MEDYKKKYEDALRKAKENKPLEEIFPELAESEDEKIRKEILDFFLQFEDETLRGVDISSWIAWLEKHGEKTNPYSGISFEYNGHTWGMCARDNGVDILCDKHLIKHLEKQDGQKLAKTVKDVWKDMRLEAYAQATGNRHEPNYSDDNSKIFSINDIDEIFEKISDCVEQKPETIIIPKFREGDIITSSKNTDIKYLIKEVGVKNELGEYDYVVEDITKTEYKGRVHHIAINKVDRWGVLVKEKPVEWSEEDEKMLSDITDCIINLPVFFESIEINGENKVSSKFISEVKNWLKSFKDRVLLQTTWKPSDEQMEIIHKYAEQNNYDGNVLTSLYRDLKKLKKIKL